MTRSQPSLSRTRLAVAALALAGALAACGPQDGSPVAEAGPAAQVAPAAPPAPPPAPPVQRGELGTVTAVTPLHTTKDPSGAGAVIGGVLGAAVGNQIGGGNGRKAATVLGAVGGAAAGHRIEKDRNTTVTGYRIDVQLDGGGSTSVTQDSSAGYSSGQRVRVLDGTLGPA